MAAESAVRMNFHEDCETAINKQINSELYVGYAYLSMSYYFAREDVALPGAQAWCMRHSEEEKEHAHHLLEYQVLRGGKVLLKDIPKPEKDEFGTPVEALQFILGVEKKHLQRTIDLHAVAHKHHDGHLSNFVEEKMLTENTEEVKEIADMITQLTRAGPGLGEYVFDKDGFGKTD